MRKLTYGLMAVVAAGWLAGCSTAPKSPTDRARLLDHAIETVKLFEAEDPGLRQVFEDAAGYAVFPSVGKGGAGLGGAYGKGILFEDGHMAGYCDVSQATIGFQLGGQAYREVIFFATALTLDEFKSGDFAFAAQASAVAATAGASADADYDNGVMVFTMEKGGLMYEASIGGQKFSYIPK